MRCYSIVCGALVIYALALNLGAAFKQLSDDAAPYQVSIQIFDSYFQKWCHICGGSIIAANYILTAAHCFQYNTEGIRRIVTETGGPGIEGSQYDILEVKAHPNYTDFHGSNIAVVKVSPSFESYTKIGFESVEPVPGNISAIYVGGTGAECGVSSNLLEIVDFLTISNAECLEVFPNLVPTELCATVVDDFMMDLGGPLVSEEKHVQIGIAVYGYNRIIVFTRVSAFVDWIKDEIAK